MMEKILSFLNFLKVDFNFSPGVLLAGLFFVFILLYGLSLGRTRAVFSFLGIYIAYAVQSVFPYWDWLHETVKFSPQPYFTKVSFFLAVYFAVFLILNKSLAKNRLTITEASFFAVTIISLLQLGLLLIIVLGMLPLDIIARFVPAALAVYFITPPAVFFWFTVPIPALLLVKRGKEIAR